MKLRNKRTGEIDDFLFDEVITGRIDLYRRVGTSETKNIWHYNSLAELNEEWEDAEDIDVPSMPLIKDKRIRKAVRAWAEVVRKEETFVVTYNAEYHDCCIYTAGISNTAMIDLGIDLNINEGSYTITELCGEEEE